MTLIDIFEHILDGFEFNNDKIDHLMSKGEDFIYNAIDKTLDFIK